MSDGRRDFSGGKGWGGEPVLTVLRLTDAELAAAVAKLRHHYPEHDPEVLGSAILHWLETEVGEWLADIEVSCARVGDFELSLQAVQAALGAAI